MGWAQARAARLFTGRCGGVCTASAGVLLEAFVNQNLISSLEQYTNQTVANTAFVFLVDTRAHFLQRVGRMPQGRLCAELQGPTGPEGGMGLCSGKAQDQGEDRAHVDPETLAPLDHRERCCIEALPLPCLRAVLGSTGLLCPATGAILNK